MIHKHGLFTFSKNLLIRWWGINKRIFFAGLLCLLLLLPQASGQVIADVKYGLPKYPPECTSISGGSLLPSTPELVSQFSMDKESLFQGSDSDMADVLEYAGSLGLAPSGDVEVYELSGNISVESIGLGKNERLMRISAGGRPLKSFLMGYYMENGSVMIRMRDRESGIVFNLSNGSVSEAWAPHYSCELWKCYGYYFEWIYGSGIFMGACSTVCSLMESFPNEFVWATCAGCLSSVGATGFMMCSANPCSWYPCFQDCTDINYQGPWTYYCSGDDLMRKRYYYAYECSGERPAEGICLDDWANSGWSSELSQSCQHGCNSVLNKCNGAVTCYQNSDCGHDGWAGEQHCSGNDVYQIWRSFRCIDAGTEGSSCTSGDEQRLQWPCDGGSCANGQCYYSSAFCSGEYPYECNGMCWKCTGGNEAYHLCCPDEGNPTLCCSGTGPYCNRQSGSCSVCGGNYPIECNGGCYGCPTGGKVCCPESGSPHGCFIDECVCMPDGSCCLPQTEVCDGVDNDCDGKTDENTTVSCGVGICSGGSMKCTNGTLGECSTAGLSRQEACNGLDDDCDGKVDESLSRSCGSDIGVCRRGVQYCSAGSWGLCAGETLPMGEECNGLDDDCDYFIDEEGACGEYPNVTMLVPENFVDNTTSMLLECLAEDDKALENISYYSNYSGIFRQEAVINISGTMETKGLLIRDLENDSSFFWTCSAADSGGRQSLPAGLRRVFVDVADDTPPLIEIQSPESAGYDGDSLGFRWSVDEASSCHVSLDGESLGSVSGILEYEWHNATGNLSYAIEIPGNATEIESMALSVTTRKTTGNASIGMIALHENNTGPQGIHWNGSHFLVADLSGFVYVYNSSFGFAGSWPATPLASGIASNGTHVFVSSNGYGDGRDPLEIRAYLPDGTLVWTRHFETERGRNVLGGLEWSEALYFANFYLPEVNVTALYPDGSLKASWKISESQGDHISDIYADPQEPYFWAKKGYFSNYIYQYTQSWTLSGINFSIPECHEVVGLTSNTTHWFITCRQGGVVVYERPHWPENITMHAGSWSRSILGPVKGKRSFIIGRDSAASCISGCEIAVTEDIEGPVELASLKVHYITWRELQFDYGPHTLSIQCEDVSGNSASREITFSRNGPKAPEPVPVQPLNTGNGQILTETPEVDEAPSGSSSGNNITNIINDTLKDISSGTGIPEENLTSTNETQDTEEQAYDNAGEKHENQFLRLLANIARFLLSFFLP